MIIEEINITNALCISKIKSIHTSRREKKEVREECIKYILTRVKRSGYSLSQGGMFIVCSSVKPFPDLLDVSGD